MKRIVAFLGLAALLAVSMTGCDILAGKNKIQYPVDLSVYEIPADPINLVIQLDFFDETPDSTGVDYSMDVSGNLIKIILTGNSDGSEDQGSFSNTLVFYADDLTTGTYTLEIEGEKEASDEFTLVVEDSSITITGETGEIARIPVETEIMRIFPNMLLIETGFSEEQSSGKEWIKTAVGELGAQELSLTDGYYSIFEVDSGLVKGNRAYGSDWLIAEFDSTECILYLHDGQDLGLEQLFVGYADSVQALSIRTGAGFDRTSR